MWNEKGKGKSNTKEVHFQVFFRVSFKRRKLFVPSTQYRFSSNEMKLVCLVLNEGYHSCFFKISWFTFCVIFIRNIEIYVSTLSKAKDNTKKREKLRIVWYVLVGIIKVTYVHLYLMKLDKEVKMRNFHRYFESNFTNTHLMFPFTENNLNMCYSTYFYAH